MGLPRVEVQSGGLSSYRWPAPGEERVSGSSATLPQCDDDELCLEDAMSEGKKTFCITTRFYLENKKLDPDKKLRKGSSSFQLQSLVWK